MKTQDWYKFYSGSIELEKIYVLAEAFRILINIIYEKFDIEKEFGNGTTKRTLANKVLDQAVKKHKQEMEW